MRCLDVALVKTSLCRPHAESQRLQQDLDKVQQLEGKISGELSSLKEHVATMEKELHTYRDLDTLKRTADDKKKVKHAGLGGRKHTAPEYMPHLLKPF